MKARILGLVLLLLSLAAPVAAQNTATFPPGLPLGCTDGQGILYNLASRAWECGAVGGSGAVGTDTIWDAAGDLVYGTGANTAGKLVKGTAAQVLRMNAGATAPEWWSVAITSALITDAEIINADISGSAAISFSKLNIALADVLGLYTGTPTGSKYLRDDGSWQAIAGGGDALVSSTLAQFAPTTSAQLKVVLSDELGNASGKALFALGQIDIASGKTATVSNTLTFTGTDSSTVAFGAGGTVLYSGGSIGTPSGGSAANLTSIPVANATGDLAFANLTQCATDTILANTSAGTGDVSCVAYATLLSDAGVASFTDPGADCVLEWDDSGGIIECAEASTALTLVNLVAGAVDWGAATSFEVPNAAAPTVDAFGEIAGDNNLWAASRGTAIFFDGTAATAFVNVLVSDTPSNGQVPKWNTGGTITWENDSTGSALGSSLTSSTNDILASTGNDIVLGKSAGEAVTFSFGTSNTMALSSTTGVVTFDHGGMAITNGTISLPFHYVFQLAGCQNTTATVGMNTPTTLGAAGACESVAAASGDVAYGAAVFVTGGANTEVHGHFPLPSDWTGAIDVQVKWRAVSTTTNDVVYQIKFGCVATGEASTAVSLNNTAFSAVTNLGTTLQWNVATKTGITTTGCAAGEQAVWVLDRDTDTSGDTLDADVQVMQVDFTYRRNVTIGG